MTVQETNSTKTRCVPVPRHALNPIKEVRVSVCVGSEEILLSHQIALTQHSPSPHPLPPSPALSTRHAAPCSNVSESICAGHYYFSSASLPPDIFYFSLEVREGGAAPRWEDEFGGVLTEQREAS